MTIMRQIALWILLRFILPAEMETYLFRVILGKDAIARIKRANMEMDMQCALYGHDWRNDVPGYSGHICVRCGRQFHQREVQP